MCRQHADQRIVVELGSQADPAFLNGLGRKYAPSVIIDDGSHNSDHQILSLECLFPFLAEGGVYVVEDLFFQLNPIVAQKFRGDGPVLATDYLLGLARERAGAPADPADRRSPRAEISRQLDRIEFVRGTAVLFKRPKPTSPAAEIALAEQILEGSKAELGWDRLYHRAIQLPNQLEAAERATKMAFERNGKSVWYHTRLSEIREKQGNIEDAISEARRAVDLTNGRGGYAECQSRLARLLSALASASG
jgi:hypothetical protein